LIDLNIRKKIIEHAISLGKARGAEIVAIHVIDPGHGIPGARIKEKELERGASDKTCS
jgi:nucleotide-binding universal stress UspA family protein